MSHFVASSQLDSVRFDYALRATALQLGIRQREDQT